MFYKISWSTESWFTFSVNLFCKFYWIIWFTSSRSQSWLRVDTISSSVCQNKIHHSAIYGALYSNIHLVNDSYKLWPNSSNLLADVFTAHSTQIQRRWMLHAMNTCHGRIHTHLWVKKIQDNINRYLAYSGKIVLLSKPEIPEKE